MPKKTNAQKERRGRAARKAIKDKMEIEKVFQQLDLHTTTRETFRQMRGFVAPPAIGYRIVTWLSGSTQPFAPER